MRSIDDGKDAGDRRDDCLDSDDGHYYDHRALKKTT